MYTKQPIDKKKVQRHKNQQMHPTKSLSNPQILTPTKNLPQYTIELTSKKSSRKNL